MNQKVLYSMMGLAALPIGTEAAVVQDFVQANWQGTELTFNNDLILSAGAEILYPLGKLVPGKYDFTCSVKSRIYPVKFKIGGEIVESGFDPDEQFLPVQVHFELTEETNVILSIISTGRENTIAAGAEFEVSNPKIELDDNDITTAKQTLLDTAADALTILNAYTYDTTEDLETLAGYTTTINGIGLSYADYKTYELYLVADEKSTIQKNIAALLEKAKEAQAAFDEANRVAANEAQYNSVNDAINTAKALLASARAALQDVLVDAAEYLGTSATAELDALNDRISKALTDNLQKKNTYATEGLYTDAEADAIKATIPTEAEIDAIVNQYTTDAAAAIAAYQALVDAVDQLQEDLDNVNIDPTVADQFTTQKAEAQAAIDAIDGKVKDIYGKSDPALLDITNDVADAQALITKLAADAAKAAAEFSANAATVAAIADVQNQLDEATAALEGLMYGEIPVSGRYATLVGDLQEQINDYKADAAAAYENGTAQTYNANLDLTALEAAITEFATKSLDAYNHYNKLFPVIEAYYNQVGRNGDLRLKYKENADIYDSFKSDAVHPYDFKYDLDIMMRDVNTLYDTFIEVMQKEGVEHWTALLAIQDTFDNPQWIIDVNLAMDKSLNYYKATSIFDSGSGKALEDRIDAFNATYNAANVGVDYQTYKDQEDAIAQELADLKAEIARTDTYSETAETAALIEKWEAKIAELAAQQTELENAVQQVYEEVALALTTKTGLLDEIDALQATLDGLEVDYLANDDKLGLRTQDVQIIEKAIEDDLVELRGKVDAVDAMTGQATATTLAGYQDDFNAISGREAELESLIAKIAADVAANNDKYVAVGQAITDLKAWEVNELKDLAVTDSNGDYDRDKDGVKKTEPVDPWYLFETGLDRDATYAARKAAIDAKIQALLAAVDASYAAETLVSDWRDGIGENTVSAIKAEITALVNAVAAEVANYAAYEAIMTAAGELDNAIAAVTDLEAAAGPGAKDYYNDLFASYVDDRDDIVTRVEGSVNGRTAAADRAGYETEIDDLLTKVNAILSNAAANYAKYLEQKDEWADIQNEWNEAYAKIANEPEYDGGKLYKSRQEYLDALDEIQTEIDAVGLDVEGNYTTGQAVAGALAIYNAFTEIRAKLQNLIQSESDDFIPAVAADNAANHATFTDALSMAQDAYDKAVAALAANSSSNIDIANAIYDLTHAYADQLDAFGTQLTNLQNAESAAYLAVVSPDTYDSSSYIQDATDLQQAIIAAMNTFTAAAAAEIHNFWLAQVVEYNDKVAAAEAVIAGYSVDAKTDAFKDVVDILTRGDNATTLKAVEAVLRDLENIDAMLAADINNAAKKDIQLQLATVDVNADREALEAYGEYADLDAFEDAVSDYVDEAVAQTDLYYRAGTLADHHDEILALLANYPGVVTGLLADADAKKVADEANTAAYNEMAAALASVQDQLDEAQGLVAQYKYSDGVSFDLNEQALDGYAATIEDYAKSGAVAGKDEMMNNLAAQEADILDKLTRAFEYERTSLDTDLTDAKNWFNNYVAENGLDETAQGFRDRIDAAVLALNQATIDPSATFEEVIDATEAMLTIQGNIITLLNELGALANDAVLAALTESINTLKEQATLEGMDEWVGKQDYAGTTLNEFIAGINEEIAALEAEIAAQENIAFYEKNYTDKVNAIQTKLEPALEQAARDQAIVVAENTAYAAIKTSIDACAASAAAAKEKVEAYNVNNNGDIIRVVDEGISAAYAELEARHSEMTNVNNPFDPNYINEKIQEYLDASAHDELAYQQNQLVTNLSTAIGEESQRYSPAQWRKVIAQKNAILAEINGLNDPIANAGDAEFADIMQTINDIQDEINILSTLVDDMVLLNGDANGDDRVNVLDYQLVANWILDPSKQPEAGSNIFTVVDVNENEAIEVGDLTGIVNIIMNKQWDGTNYSGVKAYDGTKQESVNMSMTSNQDGTGRIAITLDNFRDYTAFQLDVTLPEGMTIIGKDLSSRAADSHNLWSRKQQNGSVRFLASSVTGDIFSGNAGDVLYIDVKMEAGYHGGEIQVNNILFSDVTSASYGFVLGDNATDIATVGTLESLKRQVYDLGGRLMNGIRKGINIIRNADGSVEKRMVK